MCEDVCGMQPIDRIPGHHLPLSFKGTISLSCDLFCFDLSAEGNLKTVKSHFSLPLPAAACPSALTCLELSRVADLISVGYSISVRAQGMCWYVM